MDRYSYLDNANAAYIEDLYLRFRQDPDSIDVGWQRFFEGYEVSNGSSPSIESAHPNQEVAVVKLINAYRARGHLLSETNPIRPRRKHKADLSLDYFGLSDVDLKTSFEAGKEIKIGRATLEEILSYLKKTYCSSIGVEYMYCRDDKLREWLIEEMESIGNQPAFSLKERRDILKKIDQAVTFESFLQKKYVGKKRFSLEGLESLIPSLEALINQAAQLGAREFVMGMAHRGRLNVLVNIFRKSYEDVFSEFEETSLPGDRRSGGDVKYHLGRSADVTTVDGHPVHLSLVPNASHLEAVNPVVQGIVYAKQLEMYDANPQKVIPILVHGDAAISGQGVNYEVSNISKLRGFRTGGTIHIVLNNQVGFTADFFEYRSSVYCTDIAKVTESPVFHVNADDPEAVVHAMKMAVKIRQIFQIDVYVDILGYRRYGHNEGDEPRFTQPRLYRSISNHPNVRDQLMDRLLKDFVISEQEASEISQRFKDKMQERLHRVKEKRHTVRTDYLQRHWEGFREAVDQDFEESVPTGVEKAQLDQVAEALVYAPTDFQLFPKMKKLLSHRKELYFQNQEVDWAMAELLAYGSLLLEGHPVRLTGQDSQRGTFSHRHAVIKDEQSEKPYIPIDHISDTQAHFQVYNTLLSEYCALGFEYGYSFARPDSLILWEAQFGDFANGAQIIIDEFISSSEVKWFRMSGLVLLLPHGYEGQGPDHSSARPERFLQLCAQNNMYVVNVTTPANFFHVLRRQIKNPFRKPLVVLTPKSLIRHPRVLSEIQDLSTGNFQELLEDPMDHPRDIRRIVLCSGKVYYDLLEQRERDRRHDVTLVRLEQLYPLPMKRIQKLREQYHGVEDWVWVQEEPENMGAWAHLLRHLNHIPLRLISRDESASPATGNSKVHALSQTAFINQAFG